MDIFDRAIISKLTRFYNHFLKKLQFLCGFFAIYSFLLFKYIAYMKVCCSIDIKIARAMHAPAIIVEVIKNNGEQQYDTF